MDHGRIMRTRLVIMLLSLMGCGEFVDDDQSLDTLIGDVFIGQLRDADLSENVELTDRDSTLELTFTQTDPIVAQVHFEGEFRIRFLRVWWDVEGPLTETIENLTVEDGTFAGSIVVKGVTLHFDGEFNREKTALNLDIENIGTLNLQREETNEDGADT